MKRAFFVVAILMALLGVLPGAALAADANGNHDAYQFLIGTGGVEGPDVAVAANGSTVTLTGTGMFQADPQKMASGGGTYTIKDAAGKTLASGTWTVAGMLGFVNYGCGVAMGEPLPPNFCGGEAKLRVTLAGAGEGVMPITCLVGSPPAGKPARRKAPRSSSAMAGTSPRPRTGRPSSSGDLAVSRPQHAQGRVLDLVNCHLAT